MAPDAVSKEEALAALGRAASRLGELLRSVTRSEADRPVPGLEWTAVETAAHVMTVVGRLLGDRRRSAAPGETDRLNQICLEEFNERDLATIADRLESDMRVVVERVYPRVDFNRVYPFHAGSTISGGGGAAFVLCELLVHGYDIAAATERAWEIPVAEAQIAVRGPAEFWMRLLETDSLPTVKVRVDDRGVLEFPIRSTTSTDEAAIEADAVELLLAEFGRATLSDQRIASVLAALPQV